MLKIKPKKEVKKIVNFIKGTLEKQGFKKVIIACSGGIDSTTVLFLAVRSLGAKNVLVIKLPTKNQNMNGVNNVLKNLKITEKNVFEINISPIIKKILSTINYQSRRSQGSSIKPRLSTINNLRLGNITARTRMVILYDLAKAHQALVCGTENKSEHFLGYFTRFGDQASDIEPIKHLYKTQIYQLSKYLKIPEKIIKKEPTAGLWQGQTDEKELGFSYKQADPVLYFYCEKKLAEKEILKKGLTKTKEVIKKVKQNKFKRQVPYWLF